MTSRPPPIRLIKRIRAVAFDLDGTLLDTAPDLASATNHMLGAMHLPSLSDEQVRSMIGDGVEALVERALARALNQLPPEPVLRTAIDRFKEAYSNAIFVRSRIYPGVKETLRTLGDAGLRLACVTNKSAGFTAPLLSAAGLAGHFVHILCATGPADRKPSPALLRTLCTQLDVTPASLLMVGDSPKDIRAARAAGCPVAAVTYGYTAEALIRASAPDWVLQNLTEVPTLETLAA
ncbi:MAG: phosphoglycolate phosphatase [Gammaproteobacteria bacterium]